MVDEGWDVTHPGLMSAHWRGEPCCGEHGGHVSLRAPSQITFPDAKMRGEQWEVSPAFRSPPGLVGSPSGCPKSGLLPSASKVQISLGLLCLSVKWSQAVLPCPPLGLLWKDRDGTTCSRDNRDSCGPQEVLRRSRETSQERLSKGTHPKHPGERGTFLAPSKSAP